MDILKLVFVIMISTYLSGCVVAPVNQGHQNLELIHPSKVALTCSEKDFDDKTFKPCAADINRQIESCLLNDLKFPSSSPTINELHVEIVNKTGSSTSAVFLLSIFSFGLIPTYMNMNLEELRIYSGKDRKLIGSSVDQVRMEMGWYYFISSKIHKADSNSFCRQVKYAIGKM
jgi:hypothetical protein